MKSLENDKLLDVLKLFPPNLQDQELYVLFSKVLEHGLSGYYNTQTNNHKNIYNPGSPAYDNNYIINLLGGKAISDLIIEGNNRSRNKQDSLDRNVSRDQSLTEKDKKVLEGFQIKRSLKEAVLTISEEETYKIDLVSLSMIMPGLMDMKGTRKGVETVLRILGIDFNNIILLTEPSGCKKATIVIKENVRLSEKQLQVLEKLLSEISSTCVQFTSITNCKRVRGESFRAYSEWDYDINYHYLDRNFRLDNSKLDAVQGYPVKGTRLVVSLCASDKDFAELATSTREAFEARTTEFIDFADRTQALHNKLDDQLTLDKSLTEELHFAWDKADSFQGTVIVDDSGNEVKIEIRPDSDIAIRTYDSATLEKGLRLDKELDTDQPKAFG